MKKQDELKKETGLSVDEVSWLAWLPDLRGWFQARRQDFARSAEQRRRQAHHQKEAARHRHH
jgi:hypothetical protein